LTPGDTISHYEIIDRIGAGGMGEVFKARDTRLQRIAALKILPPQVQTDRESRERFFQEARAAASLNHPNICTIYDADEADGQAFIAMEYIDGETLRDFLSSTPIDAPARTTSRMLAFGYQVARGLDKAHRMGIVHRDIKPANVMLSKEGEAKILDFGLAKLAGGLQLTQAGSTVGTAAYMSPEQARGDDVDSRSDLWSLGVILYEMLSGLKPFKGDYDSALIYSILNETPDPLKEVAPDVPADAAALIDALLAKDPNDRPGTAAEVMEVIATHASSVSFVAAPSGTRAKAALPRAQFTPARIAAIAIPVIAVLAVVLWFVIRGGGGSVDTGPAISEDVVAVLPFSVRGSADLDYLGEGMVSLLSTKLDGAGDLRTVDARALQAAVEKDFAGKTLDPAAGESIARRFGAGRFILGDVIQLGGQVELTANLYNVFNPQEAIGSATTQGASDDVFALLDGLASQLLVAGTSGRTERARDLASLTTNSLPALKAYLEGERDFRKGDFGRAVGAFSRAVELDSTFALAYYRLSIALEWGPGSPVQVHDAAVMAEKLGSRLSEKDQRLLDAFASWRDGLTEEAESKYVAYLSVYPDDVEALFQLAEIMFHTRPFRGESSVAAREPFSRVVELEPRNVHAMLHLARIARYVADVEEVERLRARVEEISPDSRLPVSLLLIKASMSDDISVDSIRAALESITDEYRANALSELWAWGHDYRRVLQLVGKYGTALQGLETPIAIATGQVAGPVQEIRFAERLDPVGPLVGLATVAASPLIGASQDSLGVLADLLAGTGDAVARGVEGEAPMASYRVGKIGLLGEALALAGREDEALQYAQLLSEQVSPPTAGTFIADGVKYIEALVALGRGDDSRALLLLEEMSFNVNYLFANLWGDAGRDSARFRLAELLDRAGRERDALRWYLSVAERGLLLVGPAFARAADISERLGEDEQAIRYYDEFLDVWADADENYQPMVEEARRRRDGLLEKRVREPAG
jgi:tRNA A-37 threonylcarbamoyl transferase component Bud32/tetratricopeptide (TPR) repeat protein